MDSGFDASRRPGMTTSGFSQAALWMLRLARNEYFAAQVRQTNPTGKSRKTMSIPAAKNIPLASSGKSVI
jgi:hypothetical protein